MQHIIFEEADSYEIAILIKTASFKKRDLVEHYVRPLVKKGIKEERIIGFDLEYSDVGKAPVSLITEYLSNLLPALQALGVNYLYVNDSAYFKKLTGVKKVEAHYGYVLPCTIKNYESLKVVLGMNYQGLFYNPDLQSKIDLSVNALSNSVQGINFTLGDNIIHSAQYLKNYNDISIWLDSLHQYPVLECDVETFSLQFWKTGVGTIAFSWDKHNGIAFPVDIEESSCNISTLSQPQTRKDNPKIRYLLCNFLETYKGKLVFHNANFDMKILVNALWMEDLLDYEGMLKGIDVITRDFDDTKIITYLATNSCAGNDLKLKTNAHAFTGNYAQDDIKDIRLIPQPKLLEYNLIDCLATAYLREKYYPIMVADNQLEIYETIFKPSVKVLLQVELTGMPLNMQKVVGAQKHLKTIIKKLTYELFGTQIVKDFVIQLRKEAWVEKNLLLKQKVKPIEDFDDVTYNPASGPQTANLIYTFMGYEVEDYTDTKQPSTKNKSIKKLIRVSTSLEHKRVLEILTELADASIILNTFVESFITNSVRKKDGVWYLHGNFNLGGTVSGRLSSSGPNLQNIPSAGSRYAKLIKECFSAPEGWLWVGADFASLEDRISALTTKDPQKLKVYTDGFDGHCLRAFSYFGEHMPDIVNTVESINSIADVYPDYRQDSKAPTFLLTYQGTYHGLIANVGMTKDRALMIEARYHDLYVISDEWIAARIARASYDGYMDVAFGLRVRTPVLKQTVLNIRATPFAAQKESRTVGNAAGQSYGLLNNRAAIEFQERTLKSQHRLDIRPAAHIHDAQYFMIRDTVENVEWFNNNLVECMEWQELPEIKHDLVKLGGNVEVFHPNWANKYVLPNQATRREILNTCKEK